MKTHYYLGWFNTYFGEKLKKMLNEDIKDRHSLVMISAKKSYLQDEVLGISEKSWLDEAGISFEHYNTIDYKTGKEISHQLIGDASVIFLLGGSVIEQNDLLRTYDLFEIIKTSNAIVLGASAGAINMSKKWLFSNYTGNNAGQHSLHHGVGFDDFSVLSHFDLENNLGHIQDELSPLLEEMTVYASNKDCAIRVQSGRIDIVGQVNMVTTEEIKQLEETI